MPTICMYLCTCVRESVISNRNDEVIIIWNCCEFGDFLYTYVALVTRISFIYDNLPLTALNIFELLFNALLNV